MRDIITCADIYTLPCRQIPMGYLRAFAMRENTYLDGSIIYQNSSVVYIKRKISKRNKDVCQSKTSLS